MGMEQKAVLSVVRTLNSKLRPLNNKGVVAFLYGGSSRFWTGIVGDELEVVFEEKTVYQTDSTEITTKEALEKYLWGLTRFA